MSIRSLPMGLASIFLGIATACLYGYGDFITAFLCILFVMLVQGLANLAACYASASQKERVVELDMAGSLSANIGLPPKKALGEAMKMLSTVAAVVGLAIFMIGGFWTLAVGAFIFLCIYFNNFSVYPLGRTPWGAVIAFLCFGPVAVCSTFLLQYAHSTDSFLPLPPMLMPLCASINAGLYALLVMIAYNYTTYDYDMENNNTTLATHLGKLKTQVLFFCMAFFLLLFQLASAFHIMDMPYEGSVVILVSISFIINMVALTKMRTASSMDGRSIQNLVMFNMFLFSIVMLVVFLVGGIPHLDRIHYFHD